MAAIVGFLIVSRDRRVVAAEASASYLSLSETSARKRVLGDGAASEAGALTLCRGDGLDPASHDEADVLGLLRASHALLLCQFPI